MQAPPSNDALSAVESPDAARDKFYAQANERFGAALVRLARAYEEHTDSQRDLLQEIHLALWKSFASYDGRCSLRTWVYRVAHNIATTHILRSRRRRTRDHICLEEIEDFSVEEDSLRTVDETRVLERVHALIRSLSPTDRQIILLYLEGLPAAQIAEIVGVTADNAAVKVHRIKRILARKFHDGGDNE